MSLPITKVNLFLLAGVATAPLFMENFRLALATRLEQAGCEVYSELLYPYGDWSRKLLPQLLELRHDLWAARTRPLRSIGGARAAAMAASAEARLAAAQAGCAAPVANSEAQQPVSGGSSGGLTLLLGHSGGGVAAVHAAGILAGEPVLLRGAATPSLLPLRVVQIGSPKCPVPTWLQGSLLYASAINAQGRPSDPVTLLGSWRVWQRSRLGLPVWRPSAPASPSAHIRLQLMGGHPDYFRESNPFLNQHGLSNLEVTVQAVMDWLDSTFRG
jgi:hypothetical protein